MAENFNIMDWVYSDTVKEHFTNPHNVLFGDPSQFDYNAKGIVGNIRCGDQMLMLLKIEDDVIKDVRWKTYGCASAIASTSMLSDLIKGMPIEKAYQIRPNDLVTALGGLPDNKIHCSVLGDKALRAAIDQYLGDTGRPGLFTEPSREICHCLGITDKDIEEAYKNGAHTWEALQEATKIGTSCGKCKNDALELLHEYEHIYG
ncbi:MAG: iron-sulfur cluster assembly scaffold protein [Spirochaetaceae bacterium]|jgi:nitrogen fixation NifU-like protein|nr:iron-sulfur cluster assembly scaffold protein [Spirochaetaceae bacterium]